MPGQNATDPHLLGARAFREWITGEREHHSRIFFVERGAETDAVRHVAGSDDLVLLPEGTPSWEGVAGVGRYDGAVSEPGDEVFFGERGVELQDYVAAAFIQIIGPTAVRFFDASSWQAFIDDAELARDTGVFPTALIDPRVLLADRHTLSAPDGFDVPSALRIGDDGSVRAGVQGEVLGEVGDLPAILATPLPRAASLSGIAPRERIAGDLGAHEWIGRYLRATDLIKMLGLGNGTARISGFGWLLVDDDLADAEPRSSDPFLLDTPEGFVLADTTTLRRQLLSPQTARVVALVQTSSTPDRATERVARALGIPDDHARVLCREAVIALGIHGGRPVSGRLTEETPR
ncbi:daptide biosynthesis RiPP recognition protein [Microbacterium sp. WHRI 7836]|uniref:daptide biosynthesis RiPP recognition protein n=1 Tax=Microbacterium sp. WHRI 7836 TaxID=3162563 RepID=UPI0032ECB67F